MDPRLSQGQNAVTLSRQTHSVGICIEFTDRVVEATIEHDGPLPGKNEGEALFAGLAQSGETVIGLVTGVSASGLQLTPIAISSDGNLVVLDRIFVGGTVRRGSGVYCDADLNLELRFVDEVNGVESGGQMQPVASVRSGPAVVAGETLAITTPVSQVLPDALVRAFREARGCEV